MRLYWRKEGTKAWRLMAEPAAILMTLERFVGRWDVSCLGERKEFPDALTLEGAKVVALDWFQETLGKLGRAVSELQSEQTGVPPSDPV